MLVSVYILVKGRIGTFFPLFAKERRKVRKYVI